MCFNKPLLVVCAIAFAARAAFAQQSVTLTVAKTQEFKQTSTATPVQVTNPFSFRASVGSSFALSSASVTPQGANPIALTGSGTSFAFTSNVFPTIAALNAAFPNTAYTFNMQTAAGAPISGVVNVPATDNYPAAPKVTNTPWIGGGALQFDPTVPFTFSWSATTANSIVLTIRDPGGTVVYNTTASNTANSVTMPAAQLRPGVLYAAQLSFANTTSSNAVVSGVTVVSIASFTTTTNFTINPVTSPPSIASPSGITLIQGQPIAYQLATNTAANATLDTASLPAGMKWDPVTHIIYGTPTVSGNFVPSYTITNNAGTNGGVLTLATGTPPAGPSLANATSITGRVGVPFSFQVTTTGASAAAKFGATNLPSGLTISSSGLISGTVTAAGSTAVAVTISDGNSTRTSSLQLTFVTDAVLPVISSPKVVRIYPGQTVSYQITATYGASRVDEPSFTVYGTLPTGLTFDPKTGVISGTFSGTLQRDSGPPDLRFLNDSPLVQLAGTNTHGTGTSPLIFLAAPAGTVNLSTRLAVGSGDDVLIGGFIVTGNAPESLILRAIGPSLKSNGAPLAGALQDPVLELHDTTGATVATNDNWQDNPAQVQPIKDTGVPPTDNRESAIVATFQPSNFTAIVRGSGGTTGIGLVELYDLGTVTNDTAARAKLAQISTRGTVKTGDDAMIGGFIIQGTTTKVLVRGIGPELSAQGVSNALQDTTVTLFNGSGTQIAFNDDWQIASDGTNQSAAIIATGVAPHDDRESAILMALPIGSYTAVLRGKNNTSGVALVEVYALQ